MSRKEKRRKVLPQGTGWREVTKGGNISEPGNARHYETGGWRTMKPIWLEEKCIHCLMCWRFCPDSSIIAVDGKFGHFDYDHCKGCGICVNICPTDAIDFVPEGEMAEGGVCGE
ncbi:MAG TPA: 4Fe-4S binding protein [Thermoanaerobacterales bacterium]|nr:4Fe-4S binding protein [Thermoanaerobacterales bacterium]